MFHNNFCFVVNQPSWYWNQNIPGELCQYHGFLCRGSMRNKDTSKLNVDFVG